MSGYNSRSAEMNFPQYIKIDLLSCIFRVGVTMLRHHIGGMEQAYILGF